MGAVELVKQYYARVDAGEVEELVALFTPDAVYDRPGYPTMRGHDALTRFYNDTRVIRRGAHSLEQWTVAEPVVAVHGEFTGTLRDGAEVRLRFADFFTLAPGEERISRRITFFHTPLV